MPDASADGIRPSAIGQPLSRNRPVMTVLLAGALVVVFGMIGGAAWVLRDWHRTAWQQAVRTSENIAAVFDHDISRNIEMLNLSLEAVSQGLRLESIWSVDADTRGHILFDGAASAEFLGTILVLDEKGDVIAASGEVRPKLNFADRDYFRVHRDRPDVGVFVSRAIKSRVSRQWVIAVSRRIDHPDGSFAGVAIGTVRLGFFTHLFDSIDSGSGGVALSHTDGVLIVRKPYVETEIGRDISHWHFFAVPNPQGISAYEATSEFDGVDRLYVNRKIRGLPLVLTIFVDTDTVFAEWRGKAITVAIAVYGLTLVAGGLGLLAFRELRRRGRAEHVALDNERRYRLLAENSSDIIDRLSLDGTRRYVSPACLQLYGIAPDTLVGTDAADQIHPDDRAKLLEAFAALRSGQERVVLTARTRRADGNFIWVEYHMRLAQDLDARTPEIISIARDVTAREIAADELRLARDQAEGANRAKSLFLANMSHELRTPLNAVIGFSDILSSETFGPLGHPRYREYADDIRSSGLHLLEMISDVLDHAKAEQGYLELAETRVEIAAIVEFAVRLTAPRAERAGVMLTSSLAANAHAVHGDERRLRQILLNLTSNAVKFTPSGGRIAITARLDRNGDMLLAIEDTGTGIAEAEQARILEPFVQVRTAGSDAAQEGSGLGLPLTKRLVELHGGSLLLQSHLGVGTTVTVRLPANRVIAPPSPTMEAGASEAATPIVLVADDDDGVREIAVAVIEGIGLTAIPASGANEALAYLQSGEHIDLLFSDVVMPPGMSGVELAHRATVLRPGLKILLASGFTGKDGTYDPSGNRDFPLLDKPYRAAQLEQAIGDVLGISTKVVSIAGLKRQAGLR